MKKYLANKNIESKTYAFPRYTVFNKDDEEIQRLTPAVLTELLLKKDYAPKDLHFNINRFIL